ncbi:hypothetical protein SAMN06297387_12940 [Streptomyces zhaozhouensis]|uniref:Uncharacterized protein n=1 Tax=Streptomyces zhaozhouensis TaxID=1300267 RepID=A0A286E8L1_9ACTN|nr:hypothetical protein [Streptomyces zhaozhouensis]SOD67247.1 hypothetical protein SAMN06297387_12940 [Streptomyces zhaozhouensis]
MDLKNAVEAFPNVAALDGVPDAWEWSPAPGLNFSGVVDASSGVLFQSHYRGKRDTRMDEAVAKFIRAHSGELAVPTRPLNPVSGFSAPGYSFDVLVSLPPEIHRHYEYENPELNPFVYVVFPAYALEFAGDEDEAEAEARERQIDPWVLDREPVPYLKMRFDNTRTQARSRGSARGFARHTMFHHELGELEGSPGSFVEFENRRHEVWRVEWDGGLVLTGAGVEGARRLDLAELRAFADERLRGK